VRSKHDPGESVADILENIAHIESYVSGIDRKGFEDDRHTRDAVERCLERICEAAFQLGDTGPALMPEQPWHDIRGMGNWFRHGYDRIELDVVWRTVQNRLPSLKADAERALADLRSTKA
jgi:uncharacterized protein with HEPN domain